MIGISMQSSAFMFKKMEKEASPTNQSEAKKTALSDVEDQSMIDLSMSLVTSYQIHDDDPPPRFDRVPPVWEKSNADLVKQSENSFLSFKSAKIKSFLKELPPLPLNKDLEHFPTNFRPSNFRPSK